MSYSTAEICYHLNIPRKNWWRLGVIFKDILNLKLEDTEKTKDFQTSYIKLMRNPPIVFVVGLSASRQKSQQTGRISVRHFHTSETGHYNYVGE